jgi:hypothetical protein
MDAFKSPNKSYTAKEEWTRRREDGGCQQRVWGKRASCLRAAPDRHVESRAVGRRSETRRAQGQCCQHQRLQGRRPTGWRCRTWAWRRGLGSGESLDAGTALGTSEATPSYANDSGLVAMQAIGGSHGATRPCTRAAAPAPRGRTARPPAAVSSARTSARQPALRGRCSAVERVGRPWRLGIERRHGRGQSVTNVRQRVARHDEIRADICPQRARAAVFEIDHAPPVPRARHAFRCDAASRSHAVSEDAAKCSLSPHCSPLSSVVVIVGARAGPPTATAEDPTACQRRRR